MGFFKGGLKNLAVAVKAGGGLGKGGLKNALQVGGGLGKGGLKAITKGEVTASQVADYAVSAVSADSYSDPVIEEANIKLAKVGEGVVDPSLPPLIPQSAPLVAGGLGQYFTIKNIVIALLVFFGLKKMGVIGKSKKR